MVYDTVLLLIKVLSVVLTGILGIVGVSVDFRDKVSGLLNRWGKLNIAGIGVSMFLAGGAEVLVIQKERQSGLDQQRENAAMLRNIERAVDPLDSLRMSAWLTVDLSDPSVKPYRDRLLTSINQALAVHSGSPQDFAMEGGYLSSWSDNRASQITIDPDGPLFPDSEKEKIAHYLLAKIDITVAFRESRNMNGCYDEKNINNSLSIDFGSTEDDNNKINIEYDINNNEIGLVLFGAKSESRYWTNNSNILSVTDLIGKEVIISVRSVMVPSLDEGNEERRLVDKMRRHLEIRTVNLELPRGRQVWLRDLKPSSPTNEGLKSYRVIFPSLTGGEPVAEPAPLCRSQSRKP